MIAKNRWKSSFQK